MKNVLLLTLVSFLFQCSTKNDTPPSNLIPKEKLANILTDIHQAESKVNNLAIINSDTNFFLFRKLQNQILEKYGVDTTAYFQSYKYYLINPEDFTDIYKQVVSQLTVIHKKDSTINAKLALKKPKSVKIKTDSLAKLRADSLARKQKISTTGGLKLLNKTFKKNKLKRKLGDGKK
jgi:Domain of unknown function (DUF4296)